MKSSDAYIAKSIDEIHYRVMDLVRDFPVGEVLDFPCGWGRLSCWLQEMGHAVKSCDLNLHLYPDSPIHHIRGDLNKEFPFPDATFDYAFCIDGPEHSENLYHTFREFCRVLRPDGRLVLSMPNYSNIESRIKQLFYGVIEPINTREDFENSKIGTGAFHVNRPSFPLLRMALEAAGFSIEMATFDQEKRNQKFLYPLYLMIRLFTYCKGEKGQKKYWLRQGNHRDIAMGGNTLILVTRKVSV
jgi:SAM-dependent methyltransferase